MSNPNPFNLPVFPDAYDVNAKQAIRIEMSGETALYSIFYPSGMFKRDLRNYELETELARYIKSPERIEEVIRYTTEWRRVNYYPDSDLFYSVFPNGQEYQGGAGNHTSFGRDFIFNKEESDDI